MQIASGERTAAWLRAGMLHLKGLGPWGDAPSKQTIRGRWSGRTAPSPPRRRGARRRRKRGVSTARD
eukprot:1736766-Lingulodinium_polyedra.AAC.1